MAGRTISISSASGILLGDATTENPVGILAGVTIAGSAGPALTGGGAIDWTIDNAGTLRSTAPGTAGLGVSLTQGTFTNEATGLVSGVAAGVYASGNATVISAGSIAASDTVAGVGVLLGAGAVVNGAGGTITGGLHGVKLATAGAVINSGSIAGATGDGALLAGGAFTNATSAAVSGYNAGVSMSASGVVLNQGLLTATRTVGAGYTRLTSTDFVPKIAGLIVGGGSSVSNASTGIITSSRIGIGLVGTGSIVNAGTITANGTVGNTTIGARDEGFGIWMAAGGAATNLAGGTISGSFDAIMATGTVAVTVINQGILSATRDAGIDLITTGQATNDSTGTITSGSVGILLRSAGTQTNHGSIAAAYGMLGLTSGVAANSGTIISDSHGFGAGVQLKAGGTITNQAGGYIRSNWVGAQLGGFTRGANTYAAGGTIINDGNIVAHDLSNGNGAAVWVKGNGVIINHASGTIAGGPYGIVTYDQVTIDNAGTIGGSPNAILASNAGMHDLIIARPGSVFTGAVQGDKAGSSTGTLELANGGLAGSLSGFGTQFTGFSNVIVDAGARWTLGGTVASGQTIALPGSGSTLTLANPGAVAGTISGFGTGDHLVLAGITDATSATLQAGNLLRVVESGGGTISLQLDPGDTFASSSFGVSVSGGSTTLSAPCFAAGTRLLTDRGPVAVEDLRAGMRLVSAFGGTVPVVWIGHRTLDCARHPRPWDVHPVRVTAGAFGDGRPAADLLLSPDHAVFAGGALVPVRYLLNGRTIVQEAARTITYYHVEAPAHDVLLAEGLPCESYLDTGNRGSFANGGPATDLHPDFARAAWESGGCAPLLTGGAALAALRADLLARAAAMGHAVTTAPDLRVIADGRELPAAIDGDRWTLALPAGTRRLVLRSRAWVPGHMTAAETDMRALGVALADIALDGAALTLDDPRLAAGWHEAEADWRWTDGAALIEANDARRLAFRLALAGVYWAEPPRRSAQSAVTA